MPTPPLLASHRWRDIQSVPIHDQCRADHSAVEQKHGALSSRLHPQDQIFGRDTHRLAGCFDDGYRLVIPQTHPGGD